LTNGKIDRVIDEARSYIGTEYKWGGNDSEGIDCSGLLVRSFESVGMRLPRTTAQQIELGKKVSLKKSKKGDLVFFALGKSRRKVTHVGILSKHKNSSDINFIHASSSRGVIETQLIKDYYLKRIRKLKRVF
tara:strand:- start:283 stop:678 length:396 start_codon:yes stop_codon:yes gene_type:complete